MKRLLLITVLINSLIFISCKKEEDEPPQPKSTAAVLIGNEGLTPNGSASISAYNPHQKIIENNVFQKSNIYPVGNGLNSLLVDGDKTFLVMKGSAQVIVINTHTYEVMKRITNLGAPRHIIKIAENKYYISDWQEEGVLVLNYNSGKIVRLIPTGLGPEKMILKDNLVFVANSGGGSSLIDSSVTVIHAMADTVITDLKVGVKPNSLQMDKEDRLWVLSGGITDINVPINSISGDLRSFDLSRDSLAFYPDSILPLDTITMDNNLLRLTHLEINSDGSLLYFLDQKNGLEGDLRKHRIVDSIFSMASFIPGDFNSFGYDKVEKEIYLGVPKDYLNAGEVHRYNENGAQLDLFKVGIIPVSFGFK